uniref:Uncharacterized protein n=1 Tax=Anopheles melas TaxID=34690 RepID=A0A182UJ05_9DIPT
MSVSVARLSCSSCSHSITPSYVSFLRRSSFFSCTETGLRCLLAALKRCFWLEGGFWWTGFWCGLSSSLLEFRGLLVVTELLLLLMLLLLLLLLLMCPGPVAGRTQPSLDAAFAFSVWWYIWWDLIARESMICVGKSATMRATCGASDAHSLLMDDGILPLPKMQIALISPAGSKCGCVWCGGGGLDRGWLVAGRPGPLLLPARRRHSPLSDESDVGSEVSIGLESPLHCFGGDVLLSLSSELSDSVDSNHRLSSFWSVLMCWSLYMSATSCAIVTPQYARCGQDIR